MATPSKRFLGERSPQPGSCVFILAAGRVKVARVDVDGNELLLAIRGVADILGELAVLGGRMRSATVTALVPCITSRSRGCEIWS